MISLTHHKFNHHKIQIKTVLRCHLSPIRLINMEKLDNVIFWQGCEKIISYIIVETEDDTNPMEENFSVLSKMNLPFWPATKLLEFRYKERVANV